MIIRTCAYDKCAETFTPKPKGMKQLYCRTICRGRASQQANPRPNALQRLYDQAYYYRNQEACQLRARERYHRRCECGRQKASASDAMCQVCVAMPSVAKALQQ